MDKDEQELIRESLDYLKKIEKIIQLGRFRINSTDEYHFILTTDCGGGFCFDKNGNHKFTTYNSSTEYVGLNIKTYENASPPPAKRIHAYNGDIVLNAENGDIILSGRNIKIFATDAMGGQVVIDSSKLFNVSSPVTKVSGEYCDISSSGNFTSKAGTNTSHGEIIHETTSGTSALKSSLLGRILSIIEQVKKFFESPCG